ncbi:MAG: hypothetical protein RSC44_04805, partial [Clostridia bacterium]
NKWISRRTKNKRTYKLINKKFSRGGRTDKPRTDNLLTDGRTHGRTNQQAEKRNDKYNKTENKNERDNVE